MTFFRDIEPKNGPGKVGAEAEIWVRNGKAEIHLRVAPCFAEDLATEIIKSKSNQTIEIEWNGRKYSAEVFAGRVDTFDPATKKKIGRYAACRLLGLRDRP